MKRILVALVMFSGCAAQTTSQRLQISQSPVVAAETASDKFEDCTNEAESEAEYAVCVTEFGERNY